MNQKVADYLIDDPHLKEALKNPDYNQVQSAIEANPVHYYLGNAAGDLVFSELKKNIGQPG